MIFKSEVSEILEKINIIAESTQNSMGKHVISAKDVFKNFKQIQNDIERAQALINREPDK